ncbi:50S ribosomal protein L10 [Methanosarcinales archaeon]|nr:MAG: 50S ribosomal protein L10 [Methanosarcinales archaeon]
MEMEHHSKHIPQWKTDEVGEIKEKITSYPVVGIVSMADIPAKQLQRIRRSLHETAVLKMSRNTFIGRAIEDLEDSSIINLKDHISLQTALIFTNDNPFKLYKILEDSKSSAPIRAGAITPTDITVEKGPTSFPPGPIVGELQNAGIPAAIESGKVVIRETKTVAKAGETVPASLATMLARLEIHPLLIGLDLRAAYEDGVIFKPEELEIDEKAYSEKLAQAAQSAFNLSVNIAYPTTTTIGPILNIAAGSARNLAINSWVVTPETIGTLLGVAHQDMLSLANELLKKDASAVGSELKSTLTTTPPIGESATDATQVEPEEQGEAEIAKKEEKTEESEEKEEGEESGMEGLGALFG